MHDSPRRDGAAHGRARRDHRPGADPAPTRDHHSRTQPDVLVDVDRSVVEGLGLDRRTCGDAVVGGTLITQWAAVRQPRPSSTSRPALMTVPIPIATRSPSSIRASLAATNRAIVSSLTPSCRTMRPRSRFLRWAPGISVTFAPSWMLAGLPSIWSRIGPRTLSPGPQRIPRTRKRAW